MRLFIFLVLLLAASLEADAAELFADSHAEDAGQRQQLLLAAMNEYSEHRYQEALDLLEKMPPGPVDPNVELFRGTALYYLHRLPESRSALLLARRNSRDPYIQENSQYFLDRIQEAYSEGNHSTRSPFWATLDLAGGYNSNVLDDPTAGPVLAKPQADANLAAGYTFFPGSPFFVKLLYSGNYEDNPTFPDNRSSSQVISAPVNLATHNWLLQVTPSYQYQTYTPRFVEYENKGGLSAKIQRGWGSGDFGLVYQTSRIRAPRPEYSYLSGHERQQKAYLDFIGSHTTFSLSAALIQSEVGDVPLGNGDMLPNAYKGIAPGLALLWTPDSSWELTLSSTYTRKKFTNIYPVDQKKRVDNEINSQAKISYRLSPRLRVFTSVASDVNLSNYGASDSVNKNYRQLTTLFGFSWDIVR
jgi:hypothetical protein